MNPSTRNVLTAALLAAAASAPAMGQETFDQPAPFDWSVTSFPVLVRSNHNFVRVDPCGVACIPMGGPVAGCDVEREGRISNGLAGGCEGYGVRPPLAPNILANTRMGGYVGLSQMFNTRRAVGFSSRVTTFVAGGVRHVQS